MSRAGVGHVPSRSSRRLAPTIAALGLLLPGVASGQRFEFGRWWWEGRLRWTTSGRSTKVDGVETGRYREDVLSAEIGIHGYLGHPAIGNFELTVAGSENPIHGRAQLGLNQLAYSAAVTLLPVGAYTLNLAYGRGSFSLPDSSSELAGRRGEPETNQTWAANLLVRRGWLRGLVLGLQGGQLSFVDADDRPERKQRLFALWSNRTKRSDTSIRFDREARDAGLLDLRSTVSTATVDHGLRFAERHTWRLSAAAIRVQSDISGAELARVQEMRANSTYNYPVRLADELVFDLGASQTTTEAADDTVGYRTSIRYRWHPSGSDFVLTPSVGLSEARRGSESERRTQQGLALAWNRRGRIDFGLSTGVALVQASSSADPGLQNDNLSYSGAVNFGIGRVDRLRATLDLGANRNEVRIDRLEVDPERPESTLLLKQIGTASSVSARLSLTRGGRRQSSAWVESSVGTVRSIGEAEAERKTLFGGVQLGGKRLSLSASGGWAELVSPGEPDQVSRYFGGSATWALVRNLSLSLGVRLDEQRVRPLPFFKTELWSAGTGYQIGFLQLNASGFLRTDQRIAGGKVKDRGFVLSASRQLAGWLPIVTGERRRGTIR